MKVDLSWIWDKYSDDPKAEDVAGVVRMREDILYLKGVIEGVREGIHLMKEQKQ